MLTVIYAQQPIYPSTSDTIVFLAGPTSRKGRTQWRIDLIEHLREHKFDGTVLVPEFEDANWDGWKAEQRERDLELDTGCKIVEWEHTALSFATHRVFWMPFCLPVLGDESDTQLGFTTRMEVGYWLHENPESLILAYPPGAKESAFIRYHARSTILCRATLKNVAAEIIQRVKNIGDSTIGQANMTKELTIEDLKTMQPGALCAVWWAKEDDTNDVRINHVVHRLIDISQIEHTVKTRTGWQKHLAHELRFHSCRNGDDLEIEISETIYKDADRGIFLPGRGIVRFYEYRAK